MNRTPVSSSHFVSVGYDTRSKTLEIEFGQSRVYKYFGVPEDVFQSLMQATSKGKFLDAQIKGIYSYMEL